MRLTGLHAAGGNGPNCFFEVELFPAGTDRLATAGAGQDDELQCLRRCAGQVAQPLDEERDGGIGHRLMVAARLQFAGRRQDGVEAVTPLGRILSFRPPPLGLGEGKNLLDTATQPTGSLGLGSPNRFENRQNVCGADVGNLPLENSIAIRGSERHAPLGAVFGVPPRG